MSVSSVPAIQFTAAGLIIPAESEILNGVLADIDAAFGGGLNQALETPQGQLASSEAAVIADKNAEIALYVNQVDPQYADGRMQDGIARIYFLTRKPATATSVQCTLTGVSGTVIPVGTLAQDTGGETYALTAAATIGPVGTVTAELQNIATGPISCAAGSLTQVYQAVSGWDAITNDAAGTLGSNVESRSDFEFRRRNSVQINANGSPGAIYASVFNVAGVLDCYVIDNSTGSTVLSGATDYPLVEHSVYVAVIGGADADIAAAIWSKKDLGCNMNGNTAIQVRDTSGYAYPYPSYSIRFERPSSVAIKFAVRVVNNPAMPASIIADIKAAIVSRFGGADGTARERIGSAVYASRYYSAISSISSAVAIIDVMVGISAATDASVLIGIDQRPTVTAADISVTLV